MVRAFPNRPRPGRVSSSIKNGDIILKLVRVFMTHYRCSSVSAAVGGIVSDLHTVADNPSGARCLPRVL